MIQMSLSLFKFHLKSYRIKIKKIIIKEKLNFFKIEDIILIRRKEKAIVFHGKFKTIIRTIKRTKNKNCCYRIFHFYRLCPQLSNNWRNV